MPPYADPTRCPDCCASLLRTGRLPALRPAAGGPSRRHAVPHPSGGRRDPRATAGHGADGHGRGCGGRPATGSGPGGAGAAGLDPWTPEAYPAPAPSPAERGGAAARAERGVGAEDPARSRRPLPAGRGRDLPGRGLVLARRRRTYGGPGEPHARDRRPRVPARQSRAARGRGVADSRRPRLLALDVVGADNAGWLGDLGDSGLACAVGAALLLASLGLLLARRPARRAAGGVGDRPGRPRRRCHRADRARPGGRGAGRPRVRRARVRRPASRGRGPAVGGAGGRGLLVGHLASTDSPGRWSTPRDGPVGRRPRVGDARLGGARAAARGVPPSAAGPRRRLRGRRSPHRHPRGRPARAGRGGHRAHAGVARCPGAVDGRRRGHAHPVGADAGRAARARGAAGLVGLGRAAPRGRRTGRLPRGALHRTPRSGPAQDAFVHPALLVPSLLALSLAVAVLQRAAAVRPAAGPGRGGGRRAGVIATLALTPAPLWSIVAAVSAAGAAAIVGALRRTDRVGTRAAGAGVLLLLLAVLAALPSAVLTTLALVVLVAAAVAVERAWPVPAPSGRRRHAAGRRSGAALVGRRGRRRRRGLPRGADPARRGAAGHPAAPDRAEATAAVSALAAAGPPSRQRPTSPRRSRCT